MSAPFHLYCRFHPKAPYDTQDNLLVQKRNKNKERCFIVMHNFKPCDYAHTISNNAKKKKKKKLLCKFFFKNEPFSLSGDLGRHCSMIVPFYGSLFCTYIVSKICIYVNDFFSGNKKCFISTVAKVHGLLHSCLCLFLALAIHLARSCQYLCVYNIVIKLFNIVEDL